MTNEKVKNTLGIVSKVLTWILLGATILMIVFTMITALTFNRNDRNLFGIRFYVVLSDSMSLSENNKDDKVHFNVDDIVLIKNVKDPTKLEVGDIISFISQNSYNIGETVTHKIRSVEVDKDGQLCYETYGTNTGASDEARVYPEYVLGKYVGKVEGLGAFFRFLKTTPGYICCILLPFLLIIGMQGFKTIKLFIKYKKEQAAIIEAEKAEIAAERKQNEEMMRELLELKAQLQKQNAPAETSNSEENT